MILKHMSFIKGSLNGANKHRNFARIEEREQRDRV
jgi:hypothetical protein